ncbi:ABC transporter ATP-binding protein [Halococcoides cellulosivorans]|uniref:ABC transporter ATP-binding protein n=1 Tax=Halococcoides cellulosivorans TaxID=1679096 RepID=A0A2R4X1D2_9EURY|nr:ABC transporter ATP-binding protein [Halococcoides cellulosivorans]AWB27600.1 ABC transporter ATP-binding protein [Halococcoides cellulosivorans]
MDAVVDATGLAKRFGETVALDDVDLTIERGEIYGLIGPNGAGKTTLARVLLGTLAPDAGQVRLFGQSPDAVDPARIGYLPQSFDPHDRLTPAELLAYYGGLYEGAQSVADVLATVGIDPATTTRYADLSGGEQRRVCVATALVNDPDLLVVDEPTTGIDPAGRRALREVFTDLRAAGTTVLLSTHDMNEAEAVADRVGMLANGRLVAEDAPDALVAAHGGASRLTIQTDAPPDALDRQSVEQTEEGLQIPAVDPTRIGAIVDRIDDAYRVEGLTWTDPDLEDVYLALAEPGQEASR